VLFSLLFSAVLSVCRALLGIYRALLKRGTSVKAREHQAAIAWRAVSAHDLVVARTGFSSRILDLPDGMCVGM